MTRLPSGETGNISAQLGFGHGAQSDAETASEVFARLGAVAEPLSPAESPEELVSEFGGTSTPQLQSASSVFSQYGASPAEDKPAPVPPPEPLAEKSRRESEVGLDKIRSALVKEGQFLESMDPSNPRYNRMKASFENRWAEQGFLEREEELSNKVTFGGDPVKNSPAYQDQIGLIRRLEEVAHRWAGTVQAGTLRLMGKEDQAVSLTQSLNDLQEYNNLLARNSALGKSAGPLVEQVGTVLGIGSLNALTGGVTGVATLFAMEDFSQGMLEAKDKAPVQQLQHAATRSAITLATTLIGGKIAEKAGVAIGESVAPMFAKTSSELFSRVGLKQLALASTIEGGEEGVQSLLTAAENARSGVDPDATDDLFRKVLKDAALGAVVGTVAQVSTSAAQLDVPTQHFSDLMDGWAKRVKKNPIPKPVVVSVEKSEYGKNKDGRLISREAVDAELHVLQQLEQEIEAQFEDGGAKELKQSILERESDIKGTQEEIRGLNRTAQNSMATTQKENLARRLGLLKKHKKDVEGKLAEDKSTLSSWREDFEVIHKSERSYLEEELNRVIEQKELPDPDSVKSEEKSDDQDVTAEPSPESESGDTTVSGIADSARRAEQKHVKRVRGFLDLDSVPAREAQATDLAFREAQDQGLTTQESASDLAESVLQNGNILGSTELAGLQTRYVDAFDAFTEGSKFLSENPSASSEVWELRTQQNDALLGEINRLSEAWIKTSSDAGAALQAQQRVLGGTFSKERAVTQGRRLKGEDLTSKEVQELGDRSQDVQDASVELSKHEKGTEEYDRAEYTLNDAMIEQKSAINLLEPKSKFWSAIEAFNSAAMRMTLSGDFVPLGRQAFFNMFTNPVQTYRNVGTFFDSFANLKVKDAEFRGFMAERAIREMPNFKILHREFGVPIQSRDTPYTEVEGSLQGRLRDAWKGIPGLKHISKLPGAQFEIAYRSWTNQHKFSLANIAFEANKDILRKPGGKEEMQRIIDHTMLATGHSKVDLGKAGQVMLVAPRYLISRLALPATAPSHLIRGGLATLQGKKNAERYIARQYVRAIVGASGMSAVVQAAASLAFGPENVSMDRDPTSGTFGYLEVNGRLFDMTGGTGFMLRTMVRGARGADELLFTGDNKERDTDVAQIVGGALESRTSPAARFVTYLTQSGVPAGEREKQGLGEYLLRNSTYLSSQALYDAAKSEGIDDAAFTTMLELWGVSSFEKK